MRCGLTAVLVIAGCTGLTSERPPVLTASDALELPQPAPDHRLPYGPDPLQFGELRLPAGPGPHPVAVVIHGGCWLAEYDLGYMSGLAAALAEAGIATWSVEYRRVGDDGGGWPGTFADVAAAADSLRELAGARDLDLTRVVAVGHSAGGHLALWLAARHRLAPDDPLRGQPPLPLAGVVALAGIPDLASYAAPEGCGAAVAELLGGQPADVPQRLRRGLSDRAAAARYSSDADRGRARHDRAGEAGLSVRRARDLSRRSGRGSSRTGDRALRAGGAGERGMADGAGRGARARSQVEVEFEK